MHEGERESFHRTALIIDCLNLLVSDTRVAERVPARRNLCTRIFRGGEVAQQHRLEEYYSIIVHQPRVISLEKCDIFSIFSFHPPCSINTVAPVLLQNKTLTFDEQCEKSKKRARTLCNL